jgi:hypothetical protein
MERTGKVYNFRLLYRENGKKRQRSFPIKKSVYEDKTTSLSASLFRFTDGIKSLNVVTDLKPLMKRKAQLWLISRKYHSSHCRCLEKHLRKWTN